MRELTIAAALALAPATARAGWITTYMAYSASVDASKAASTAQGTQQEVAALKKEVGDLRGLVLKIAKSLDERDAREAASKRHSRPITIHDLEVKSPTNTDVFLPTLGGTAK